MSNFSPPVLFQVTTAVTGFCLLCGCGGAGSTSSNTSVAPGYYRGTVTYQDTFGLQLSGTQAIVASVQAPTDFTSYGGLVAISGQGSNGVLNYSDGVAIAGTMATQVDGGQIKFTLTNQGQTVVTGTMQSASMPALGRGESIPPSGTYTGQFVVFGPNGPVSADSNVISATVNADGTFVINTNGDVFNGGFGPNHTITNGILGVAGQVFAQTTSQFSFDGSTLIFRFDQLDLYPRTEWITLTKS